MKHKGISAGEVVSFSAGKHLNTRVVSIDAGDHRERVTATRDALVAANLHLVGPIARRIHRKLPPSFDLEDLIATGNHALVRAATGYRPEDHGGAPFDSYARAAIAGAIKDTFRRNKFAEQTRPGLEPVCEVGSESRKVIEFPAPGPTLDERIDLTRRIAALRNVITACLPEREVRVMDAYYCPAMPDLAGVARDLGITIHQCEKAHASALRTLRAKLAKAA